MPTTHIDAIIDGMAGINWSQRVQSTLKAVVFRRCPQCGRGRVFEGWWRMKAACPNCGRRFQQQPGSTTGVMQMGAMAVVLFAIVAWFVIAAVSPWSMDRSLALLVIVSVFFGLWFYPYAKLLWEAVDCIIDAMNDEQTPSS